MQILLVEDDDVIAQGVTDALRKEGYAIERATDGEAAIECIRVHDYDLILLDLNLPGVSGFEVLHAVRTMHLPTPVLIITARDHVEDRVQGLDLGADDYLSKPFAMAELLARIRALFRRTGDDAAYHFEYGGIELDVLQRRATRNGHELDLTTKEFEVLELLVRNATKPVSRSMLAKVVWRDIPRATSLDNVIDVHLGRLRKKVNDPFNKKIIRTIRGVGYVLQVGD